MPKHIYGFWQSLVLWFYSSSNLKVNILACSCTSDVDKIDISTALKVFNLCGAFWVNSGWSHSGNSAPGATCEICSRNWWRGKGQGEEGSQPAGESNDPWIPQMLFEIFEITGKCCSMFPTWYTLIYIDIPGSTGLTHVDSPWWFAAPWPGTSHRFKDFPTFPY